VIICSKVRIEWYVADYACQMHGIVGCPVSHRLEEEGLCNLVQSMNVECIIYESETTNTVAYKLILESSHRSANSLIRPEDFKFGQEMQMCQTYRADGLRFE